MSNREEDKDKDESAHSAQSQDTELIETSYLETNHTSSSAEGPISSNGNHNTSLPVLASYTLEHSLLDFSSPNASTTTACSTPHESKRFGTTTKRRFTISSEEDVHIKKQRIFEKENVASGSSDLRPVRESIGASRLDPESPQEVSSSSSDVKPIGKKPVIEYAEANSSTSSTKLITNSSSDSFERIMVKKARSPGIQVQRSPLLKAFSENFNEADVAALRARNLELEAKVRHLQNQLANKSREEKDHSKETRGKHGSEKVLCNVSYIYDETEGEITSISIKQVSKADLFDHKNPRLSISSGSLADSSGSEMVNHWIQKGPSLASYSSSVTSSFSSIPSHAERGVFLVPQIPEPKRHWAYKYPKACVCHCYCNTVVDYLAKQHIRCATPETLSSSSENIKPDSQDITSLSVEQQPALSRDSSLDSEKTESKKSPLVEFRSRSSFYVPTSTNLPVFAKWPSNSFCYPGTIQDATEETWHKSTHLEVIFCDGTVKKTLSENLFPAYLLPTGTEISFERDDICETAKLISIERQMNNELVCIGETARGDPEIIPFEKIFLSNYCYKGLKKTSSSSLTPKKTPRFSISTANVTEGKRTRKIVKFDSSGQKFSESSSGRKTKSKGKRGRSTTDSSGSDVTKSDKKRVRSWSQKKAALKKAVEEDGTATTPYCGAVEKSQVSRKLYEETPSCSKPLEGPRVLPLPPAHSDTDSSLELDVNFELIKGYYLDTEKVLDISRRAVKSKSVAKRNVSGSKDDNLKGPIPDKPIFSDYNFVLTHSDPKPNPVEKRETTVDSCSEEGSGTDFEDYYSLSEVPFDTARVKEQISSGQGKVYVNLLQVPVDEHKRTLVISDNIVETPNYILAVSLGIPIFRHDLIINACKEGKHVSSLVKNGMQLPTGRALDTGRWMLPRGPARPLSGFACALSLSTNQSTTNFWHHVLTNSGAKVVSSSDTLRRILDLTFIVGDEWTPSEVQEAAREANITVVSTLWVMQTVIQGRQMSYNAHPLFRVSSLTSP